MCLGEFIERDGVNNWKLAPSVLSIKQRNGDWEWFNNSKFLSKVSNSGSLSLLVHVLHVLHVFDVLTNKEVPVLELVRLRLVFCIFGKSCSESKVNIILSI